MGEQRLGIHLSFKDHLVDSPSFEMNGIALIVFTIFVSVISASEIVHEADPHVKDQNIELEYDELVSDIRKHIQAAPLNDLDTTCNNICNLLETDANVDGKQLRAFKPFCDEKCPDLLIEAQNLNTDEKFPLQDSTLSDFIIDVLKRHDEL